MDTRLTPGGARRQHHPLVTALLGAIAYVGSLRAGVTLGVLRASELGLDRFRKASGGYPLNRSGHNGSRRVKRAALKARNVRANRRAHCV